MTEQLSLVKSSARWFYLIMKV